MKTVEVPGYTGKAVAARSGALVRVIDTVGTQIGDMFAISQEDHGEFLSPAITRNVNFRLFPGS